MSRESRPNVLVHLTRVATAIVISVVVMVAVHTLDRTILSQRLLFFAWPIAIGAGYIPLWRWYARDAYPIGLVFCPAMFFLLRYLYEKFGPWIWQPP